MKFKMLRLRAMSSFGLALSLSIALCACSRPDSSRILGHWRSDSFKLGSLNLPIAPDILIQRDELVAVASGARMPIESLAARDSEVVVTFAAGIGLSFVFEGDDRMFVDVPYFGRVYYERVTDKPSQVMTTATDSGTPPRPSGAAAPHGM